MNKLTKKQAEEIFKAENLPNIPKNDKPLLRQEWHFFTDYLCKSGQISLKQYETWMNPRFISGRK